MATGASSSSASAAAGPPAQPILATGDWTKNLVHLAKTAELKKHALTLQLHTAHILSAHASLDAKNKQMQDLKEQKNKLESERARLLNCLREVNEQRDQADMQEASLTKECTDLRAKIQQITDGEYTAAKHDVDRLRRELGQPPLPSLQATLEDKSAQYLKELRVATERATAVTSGKRPGDDAPLVGADGQPVVKRPRGRPKGKKTDKSRKDGTAAPAPAQGS
ncbi:hypothetical protein WOLCODRAFT_135756 [Wolfiporia cocos MD-104 SS10]|uniref:Uncharacterized protein n=1 Tax=Wolfiporia cocos (strain MD-104) TaxID=742152 RepID=A0A2H3J601_WOLCO|nr:hypothetical protein WOLCODRAFT_135756 [Wolfiporia cocos MD-104 SS10]